MDSIHGASYVGILFRLWARKQNVLNWGGIPQALQSAAFSHGRRKWMGKGVEEITMLPPPLTGTQYRELQFLSSQT
jgi:hypothetical protein